MPLKIRQCHLWSNQQLILHEIIERRRIAAYATGLTLTAVTGVATLGATTPIIAPIAGFKAYKIHSHNKKLKIIRDELSRRHLSPRDKKKRDILIPATITVGLYLVSMGIADVVNVVPDAIQSAIQEPIQHAFLLSVSIVFKSIALFSFQIFFCYLSLEGTYVRIS